MNDITQIAVIVRGRVVDTHICNSAIAAERYKAAVRQWGRENSVLVNVVTSSVAVPTGLPAWLQPAQAC